MTGKDCLNLEDLPPPGAGTSFKMIGKVPPRNEQNFGGFYKGFPGDQITSDDDW